MTCINSPELTDRQLLTYLDGEASSDLSAHVNLCSRCRERAAQLAQEEARLRSVLTYQTACPSLDELERYYLGELSSAQEDAVANHLATACACCQQTIAKLMAEFIALAS